MIEALLNKGIYSLGDQSKQDRPIIVVVGTARGGTSMVAGVLEKLGVYMGDAARPPVYEDLKLSTLFEKELFGEASKVVSDYSGQHEVWGWKRPSSIKYLDKVDEILQSPIYIVVYKDIMSIAQRNKISMLDDVLRGMQRAVDDYQSSLNFLENVKPTALLVSYDKVMRNPQYFIDELLRFCKLDSSVEQRRLALDSISLNPEEYLDQSRVTRAQGRLDGLHRNYITGWARYFHQPEKRVAAVNIFLNDALLVTVNADRYRDDMNQRFNHSCAFFANVPKGGNLKPGDVLRARVVGEVRDLDNSPIVLDSIQLSSVEGRLGGVDQGEVFGWVKTKSKTLSRKPLTVDIYLNDEFLMSTTANKPRPDLKERFNLNCAFFQKPPKGVVLKKGSILSAKVSGEECELENSPLVI